MENLKLLNQKIHFITYADKNYEKSKNRILNEAKNVGWFDTCTGYSPKDLDKKYRKKFKIILNQRRGAGFWIWKSYIIKKKLNEINDNDILIYLDAGCTINKLGSKRFFEYIDILNKSNEGILSFQVNAREKQYTTKEIFKYFNVENKKSITNTNQLIGGIRVMKKNSNLINMIDIEYNTYLENPLLASDFYNDLQVGCFIDNRHEQSIFSVIRKMHNPIILKGETFFKKFGKEKSLIYPFWATRKK